jgi:tetratricopeptide (TPR) repeat protein
VFCGIVVWATVRSGRMVFDRSPDTVRLLQGAFWAAAVGYCAQLLVGLSTVGNSFLLWLAIGLLLAPSARLIQLRPASHGRAWAWSLVALAALGIVLQAPPIAADHFYLKSRAEGTAADRTDAALAAARLNPFQADYKIEVAQAHAREFREALEGYIAARQRGDDPSAYLAVYSDKFDLARAAYVAAIDAVPDAYNYYLGLIDLYNLAGQASDAGYFVEAETVARKALETEPHGPEIRLRLARALLGQKKTAEAVRELEVAVRLDPAYGAAAVLLAQEYRRAGRHDEALAVLEAVEAVLPGQPDVLEAIHELESRPGE